MLKFANVKEFMKHIFVINPKAGNGMAYKEVMPNLMVREDIKKLNHIIRITSGVNDAKHFSKTICEEREDENEILRFYACGGDGTLNEVINGVYGYKNIEVACIASGSGNDFVKNFAGDFTDINSIINGKPKIIDLLECTIDNGTIYGINLINMGLDCEAVKYMEEARNAKVKMLSGMGLYIYGVMRAFLKMKPLDIKINCNEFNYEGKTTLLAFGNGTTYGGGFIPTPLAKVDDGLIDICLLKQITRTEFISLIGEYKKGNHIKIERAQKIIDYHKTNEVSIEAKDKINISVDGELVTSKYVKINIIKNAINFIIPNNYNFNQ